MANLWIICGFIHMLTKCVRPAHARQEDATLPDACTGIPLERELMPPARKDFIQSIQISPVVQERHVPVRTGKRARFYEIPDRITIHNQYTGNIVQFIRKNPRLEMRRISASFLLREFAD